MVCAGAVTGVGLRLRVVGDSVADDRVEGDGVEDDVEAMKKLFSEHPNSVGESYVEHMGMAFGFGAKMILCGAACLLHGLFPFLFVRTGSNAIHDLHRRMVTHRRVKPADPVGEDSALGARQTERA